MKRIGQGENALIRRFLKKADGTDLLLSELTLLRAEVMQKGNVMETLTYPTAKIRQGSTNYQVEVEIDTTLSEQFAKGRVSIKWTLEADSLLFSAEGIQRDVIEEDILDVK